MNKIFRCIACNLYTLKEICPKCGLKTVNPKPARFKTEDKYSKYRLSYREELKNAMDV